IDVISSLETSSEPEERVQPEAVPVATQPVAVPIVAQPSSSPSATPSPPQPARGPGEPGRSQIGASGDSGKNGNSGQNGKIGRNSSIERTNEKQRSARDRPVPSPAALAVLAAMRRIVWNASDGREIPHTKDNLEAAEELARIGATEEDLRTVRDRLFA